MLLCDIGHPHLELSAFLFQLKVVFVWFFLLLLLFHLYHLLLFLPLLLLFFHFYLFRRHLHLPMFLLFLHRIFFQTPNHSLLSHQTGHLILKIRLPRVPQGVHLFDPSLDIRLSTIYNWSRKAIVSPWMVLDI